MGSREAKIEPLNFDGGSRPGFTDWELIRKVMNGVIDACAKVEKLNPDITKGEYSARSSFQEDVDVGDFLTRFWRYPEGAQRDIIRLRSRLGNDLKYKDQLARALINTAEACAEIIGVPIEELEKDVQNFTPHCGSGCGSIRSQLQGIPNIQNGWMYTGISKALEQHRSERPTKQ